MQTAQMKKAVLILSLLLNIMFVSYYVSKRVSNLKIRRTDHSKDSLVTFTFNKYKAFDERKAFFATNPIAAGDIVFAGNSLIENFQVADYLGKIKNRGMSGDNTTDLLKRIDEIVAGHPAKVFIMEGINDIGQNIPENKTMENFNKIITVLQKGSPRTEIYVYAILPVKKLTSNPIIQRYNRQIAAICSLHQVKFIDLFPAFFNGTAIKDGLTVDGTHLTAKGYQIWYNQLKQGFKF